MKRSMNFMLEYLLALYKHYNCRALTAVVMIIREARRRSAFIPICCLFI